MWRFRAVPLLRVQGRSVIVVVRRRGASRSRPVLGRSLKSLAFSGCVRRRDATKRRVEGTRLPTPGCLTQRIRKPSLIRATWRFNMKMIKSLVLGSAASVLAMAGAQAADLPVKAKAVEYVKVCSLYGAGFWYIPGTDTCIRIGGTLRIDTAINGGIYDNPFWGTGNTSTGAGPSQAYGKDWFTGRACLNLTEDTRTN